MSLSSYNIVHFDTLDSTNSYAINKIDELADKSVISSAIQTAGRGRLQRPWVSDQSSNLYMSIVLKPEIDYKKLPLINFTQLFSVAVCEVFSKLGLDPYIKWPNDIMIQNKKCVGILSEASFHGSKFAGLVVGLGINCNMAPSKEQLENIQAVTSLADELGHKIEKDAIMNDVLLAFDSYYERFCEQGFPLIKEKYLQFFPYKGKVIHINNSNVNVSGTLIDLSSDGELQVEDDSGTLQNIALGDMVWKTF